jgi:hydroxymethylglutaryl-CoA lyase
MNTVELVEVSPRDGLQNEQKVLSVDTKVELINRAILAGVRRIETVSFANPKRVPQMAGAEDVMAQLPRGNGVSYIGLVLNRRGLDRALAAGVDEINAVVVATDEFSVRNQGCTVAEGVAAWEQIAADAREAGIRSTVTIAASFGCPFSGEVDPAWVVELAGRLAAAGPDEIAFADTIGVGVPAQVRTLADGAARLFRDIPVRWHFHNTRNTGYANALTALETGAAALDASIGGFGGCPFAPAATGNIASEDLVYALDRSGVHTGAKLSGLAETATWLGAQLAKDVPAQLGRAGNFPAT